jgi:hypothetical protein
MMRRSVCAFVLLVALCTGTGAAAPEHHVERLVALGKLWASVKYFHPALRESRPGWWDQALLGAVPSIDAASSRDEYALVLNAMLARLHDPVTR